jgi:hypothetical protein
MTESSPDASNDAVLRAEIDRLPRELAPERDLWPGIAARLAHGRRPSRWVAAGLAASLLLGATAVALSWQAWREARLARIDVARVADFRPTYDAARRQYAAQWQGLRERADPATAAVIDANLEVVRAAVADIDRALAEAPDDAALQGLLEATLATELGLYRRAVRLAPAAI